MDESDDPDPGIDPEDLGSNKHRRLAYTTSLLSSLANMINLIITLIKLIIS